MPAAMLTLRHRTIDLSRSHLVGVLNLTPDSFSDGGTLATVDEAVLHARALVATGAVIVDVGGESTRPGAAPLSAAEEEERVLPVIRAIARFCDVSIDTYHASTAQAAVAAGAVMVNDISGGLLDPAMLRTVADLGVAVVLGHLRGTPATMRDHAQYDDVVAEVVKELDDRVADAESQGIDRSRIFVDPGLGFAKRAEQSWSLLSALSTLTARGLPVMVGASRKSFLGELVGKVAKDRDAATAAVTAWAAAQGAALVRVHDPGSQLDALAVGNRLRGQAVRP